MCCARGERRRAAAACVTFTARNISFDLVATRCDTKHAAIFYIKSKSALRPWERPKVDFIPKKASFIIFSLCHAAEISLWFRISLLTPPRVLHTWQICPDQNIKAAAHLAEKFICGSVRACYHIKIQLHAQGWEISMLGGFQAHLFFLLVPATNQYTSQCSTKITERGRFNF